MTDLFKAVETINKNNTDEDYTEELFIQEVLEHGCISGMVGELIYYRDTIKFYDDHKEDINGLLYETIEDSGLSPSELFGDRWFNDDPLALETNNQNLLSWFAFEETARKIAEEKEYDL